MNIKPIKTEQDYEKALIRSGILVKNYAFLINEEDC